MTIETISLRKVYIQDLKEVSEKAAEEALQLFSGREGDTLLYRLNRDPKGMLIVVGELHKAFLRLDARIRKDFSPFVFLSREIKIIKKTPLFIIGMNGFGDSIYQRTFIKVAAVEHELYFQTSWPEFFSDLDLTVIKPATDLRTQVKNIKKFKGWGVLPTNIKIPTMQLRYDGNDLGMMSMLESMNLRYPIRDEDFVMDMPNFDVDLQKKIKTDKPIAFIRPVTIRKEWIAESRAPKWEYVNLIAAKLKRLGFFVVSVADVKDNEEWLVGEPPDADLYLHKGELTSVELVELMRVSKLLVGGVGFIVPAAMALNTPAFVILGGNGRHNSPEHILDERIDCSKIGFGVPDVFCQCSDRFHKCEKTNTRLEKQFDEWYNIVMVQNRKRT